MKPKSVQIILMLAVMLVTASDLLAQQQTGRPQPGNINLLGGSHPANSAPTGRGSLDAVLAVTPSWITLGQVETFWGYAAGGVPPYTYQWTIVNETTGEGRASRPTQGNWYTSARARLTKPGRIKVTLYVVDSQKQTATESRIIKVVK